MDTSASRSSRDFDSSPLPCPSFTDDFDDSEETGHELPPKRIRDFEFEENTLQEFPATSRNGNIINNAISFNRIISKEILPKIAKENLDPIKSIVDNHNDDDNVDADRNNDHNSDHHHHHDSSTPAFNDDLRVLQHRNISMNTRTSTGINSDTYNNCKVSIDLNKLQNLVDTRPHIFSKYDEPQLESLKVHDINLTEWNKKLLIDSKNQDNFFDNIETKNKLCKSIDNIDNIVVVNENNREELKTCSETKSNLRRGLKRKCKYSTPIR